MGQSTTHQSTASTTGRGALMTDVQAAERLGLSVKTLRNWRVSGKGPAFIYLGGAVRYAEEDLDAFIAANRRTSTSDMGEAAR